MSGYENLGGRLRQYLPTDKIEELVENLYEEPRVSPALQQYVKTTAELIEKAICRSTVTDNEKQEIDRFIALLKNNSSLLTIAKLSDLNMSNLKTTGAELVKFLVKNGINVVANQSIDLLSKNNPRIKYFLQNYRKDNQ